MKIAFFFFLFAFFAINVHAQTECDTCTTIIGIVENWVEDNATESEILQYLDTLCSLIPGYSSICDSIAQQGIKTIIQWIQQNESPTEICQQLGMCSGHFKLPSTKIVQGIIDAKPKPKVLPLNVVPGDFVCDECDAVINVIDNWLENTQDQAIVINTVEVVCTYMPDWETTCDNIVSAGVPVVIDWIVKYENSTVVCTQLELC